MGNQKEERLKKKCDKKGQKRDQISLKFFKDLPKYNQLQLHYHFQKLSNSMYIIVHPPKVWRAYIANAMKPFINYVQSEGVRWNQPKAYTTMIGSCDKCKSVLKLLDRIKSTFH